MTEQTIVGDDRRVKTRYVETLGARVRVEVTEEADETRRYRATLETAEPPVNGLHDGDVIGWGRTPARAHRRAVDKITNRRRGPARAFYGSHGVTFQTVHNPSAEAPPAHAFRAVVAAVDPASPIRDRVKVGQVLSQAREGGNAADRAVYLLGQWAEQVRLVTMQQQIDAAGAKRTGDKAVPARWDDEAVCRRYDPELFFPLPGQNAGGETAPIAVCEMCPARTECLARALDQGEAFGVWGGTTEATRRALTRRGVTGDTVRARGIVVLAMVSAKKKAPLTVRIPPQSDEQAAA